MGSTTSLPPTLPLVGRLAPSPTGAQHLGNARTYLLTWLSIRARSGRLLLRIEDIDSPRVKPWATQQAIDDLRWLGLDWDEGPDRPGDHAPYFQTERMSNYALLLDRLRQTEQVYPCCCTRSDIAQAASAPHANQEGPVYPGTCAARSSRDSETLTPPYAWRFRLPRELAAYRDGFAGPQQLDLGTLGDFVVYKSSGTPAYQLAVVADDSAMGVTEVVRGDDLIPSTFRQLALYRAFGWDPPVFYHVPLVVGTDGRRLAKRHGDTRLATLRRDGIRPETVVGWLAWSSGLLERPHPVRPGDLLAEWDWSRIRRQRVIWNPAILEDWKR